MEEKETNKKIKIGNMKADCFRQTHTEHYPINDYHIIE